jgi:hypothetical protein
MYSRHSTIPYGNLLIELMAKYAGAFTPTFNDLDFLKYPKIKEFDAVFLNNVCGMIHNDPEVREHTDEFYHFPVYSPYSRERQHILLSLDVEKSDMATAGAPLYRVYAARSGLRACLDQNLRKGLDVVYAVGTHQPSCTRRRHGPSIC